MPMRAHRRATPSSVIPSPSAMRRETTRGARTAGKTGRGITYGTAPMDVDLRLPLDQSSSEADVREVVEAWVQATVPVAWRDAAAAGGRAAIRKVRPRAAYEEWYPQFADSGLAV